MRIRRNLPVVLALLTVGMLALAAVWYKHQRSGSGAIGNELFRASLSPAPVCARYPHFLSRLGISAPVVIDLSQKRFTGVALYFGPGFRRAYHPPQWEQYGPMGTYALDERGNLYLTPTPFISIEPSTFNLQKKIYRIDSETGRLSILIDLDDVRPGPRNPYGVVSLAYDCDDRSLWAGSIDESDLKRARGTIYHLDPRDGRIVSRKQGFDALSMALARSKGVKYLLLGSARDSGLYAWKIGDGGSGGKTMRLRKILELPSPQLRIRKIKILATDRLELQAIPFGYSLVARSARRDRIVYRAHRDPKRGRWIVEEKKEKKR